MDQGKNELLMISCKMGAAHSGLNTYKTQRVGSAMTDCCVYSHGSKIIGKTRAVELMLTS